MRLRRSWPIAVSRGMVTALLMLILSFRGVNPVAATPAEVKDINLVFIHGMGSSSASTQLLADSIEEQSQEYISVYEQQNPGIAVHLNMLQRSYPNDVDIDVWAKNIADAVNKHFTGKKDLILIGHSLGGKAALYAVAQNVENLGDIVDSVVTINSPIKDLNSYYAVGGGSITNYLKARNLTTNSSLAERLGSYDSSNDGLAVSETKHWLAFISGETAPMSPEFDFSGVDPYPLDMDDGLVPISAQSAAGADVMYYGDYGHSSVTNNPQVAGALADDILRYIFGVPVQVTVPGYDQGMAHNAGVFPVTYQWQDRIGETAAAMGNISHTNNAFFKWQEWEDVISFTPNTSRSNFSSARMSIPFLTAETEVRWLNPDDPNDARLYIKTRAAPRTTVRIKWNVYQYIPLPSDLERDHYEIKVTGGAALAEIRQASWISDNTSDTRVQIESQAEGPFRGFQSDVRVFFRRYVLRKLIDGFALQASDGATP